jgi:hypothetical protein
MPADDAAGVMEQTGGTVNLTGRGRNETPGPRQTSRPLYQPSNAGDLGPGLKRLAPGYSILFSGQVVAAEIKEVVDASMDGEKTVCLAGRLEALYRPFSSAGRLVRVLGPVV